MSCIKGPSAQQRRASKSVRVYKLARALQTAAFVDTFQAPLCSLARSLQSCPGGRPCESSTNSGIVAWRLTVALRLVPALHVWHVVLDVAAEVAPKIVRRTHALFGEIIISAEEDVLQQRGGRRGIFILVRDGIGHGHVGTQEEQKH